MLTPPPAILAFADGTLFSGISIGSSGDTFGELVFNTGMTGYQEMLTDPSYARQIITLTASHIGNTGCNDQDWESSKVWAAGLVIRNLSLLASNYRSQYTLSDWLKKQNTVAIAGVDTREITKRLREEGSIHVCISTDTAHPERAIEKAKAFSGLQGAELASLVSRKAIERWYEGQGAWTTRSRPLKYHVVVYDYGVKHSILRILYDLGCHLTVVPAKTSIEEVLTMTPDGVVLSNGPGDPLACDYAIAATQKLLETNIPLFGICLGFQILGLACGAKSFKMKFGHHGSNHPVISVQEQPQRVFITSQNHGFSLDEASLPDCLEITHRSLFDQTLQGIRHKSKPVFGFQGHPEAGPGPHDIEGLFESFLKSMSSNKKNR